VPSAPCSPAHARPKIPTARHVLGPCHHAFSTALAHHLTLIAQSPTWEALYRLLVLPKMVLQAEQRRGKAHQQQQAIDVERWLSVFDEQKYEQLWSKATKKTPAQATCRHLSIHSASGV